MLVPNPTLLKLTLTCTGRAYPRLRLGLSVCLLELEAFFTITDSRNTMFSKGSQFTNETGFAKLGVLLANAAASPASVALAQVIPNFK